MTPGGEHHLARASESTPTRIWQQYRWEYSVREVLKYPVMMIMVDNTLIYAILVNEVILMEADADLW